MARCVRRTHERILLLWKFCQGLPDLLQESLCRSCASMFVFAPRRRAIRPAQCRQQVHFRCLKFAPRHSDPSHPKSAEGSLLVLRLRAAPQLERSNPSKVLRGFTSNVQHSHQPITRPKSAEGSVATLAILHARCSKSAPERSNTPNVCRTFTFDVRNLHHATASVRAAESPHFDVRPGFAAGFRGRRSA